MKKYLSGAFFLLLAALFIAVIPTDAEGMIYEDTVRLHILANSDSEEDQALKLALRDEVLNEYGRSLSFFECADEAKEALNAKQKEKGNNNEKERNPVVCRVGTVSCSLQSKASDYHGSDSNGHSGTNTSTNTSTNT